MNISNFCFLKNKSRLAIANSFKPNTNFFLFFCSTLDYIRLSFLSVLLLCRSNFKRLSAKDNAIDFNRHPSSAEFQFHNGNEISKTAFQPDRSNFKIDQIVKRFYHNYLRFSLSQYFNRISVVSVEQITVGYIIVIRYYKNYLVANSTHRRANAVWCLSSKKRSDCFNSVCARREGSNISK